MCKRGPDQYGLTVAAGLRSTSMAALAAAPTCQMRLSPAGVPAQRGTMPQQLPLIKPLGAPRGALHSKPQLPRFFQAAANQLDAAAPGFVRPDCPPDSDDETPPMWAAKLARPSSSGSTCAGGSRGSENKANFRSALEQASWMSGEEAAGRANKPRSGLLGKLGLGELTTLAVASGAFQIIVADDAAWLLFVHAFALPCPRTVHPLCCAPS